MMKDECVYRIEVQGPLDERTLNAIGPQQIDVVRTGVDRTEFTARTDQSGLLGLIRCLHGRGLVILSIRRE